MLGASCADGSVVWTAEKISVAMFRSGYSPVVYSNGTIQPRSYNESMPVVFPATQFQFPPNWLVPKNPAGQPARLGHTANLVTGGLSANQSSGSYNSDGTVYATDPSNATSPSANILATLRITPTDLSQLLYPTMPQSPLENLDFSQQPLNQMTPQELSGLNNWTPDLTGTTSWPTMMVLTAQATGINAGEPDDPGVVVCSNTPTLVTWKANKSYVVGEMLRPTTPNSYDYQCTIAGTSGAGEPAWPTTAGQTCVDGTVTWAAVAQLSAMMPTDTTDTDLWYRRVKHLVTTVTASLTTAPGQTQYNISLPTAIYNQVRVTDNGATTDPVTGDFITLRPRPFPGEQVQLPWLTARVVSKNNDGTITIDTVVNPQFTTTWNPGYTVAEIYSHPWLPLFSTDDFTGLRAMLDDRGNPTGGPHPLRCQQPSFTQDAAGNNWLAFTVATTRNVTVEGQVTHYPVSYLLFKRDQPRPAVDPNNAAQWIGTPDAPAIPGGPIVYPNRQHPQLLPNVNGLGGMALYDAAAEHGRQLLYAITTQPLTGPRSGAWTCRSPRSIGPSPMPAIRRHGPMGTDNERRRNRR